MKLSEILNDRLIQNTLYNKRKIYCIETEHDLYVLMGQSITKANSEITKVFYHYLNQKRDWKHITNKIIDYYNDDFRQWESINKDTEYNIINVYADDNKIF